MKWNSIIFIIGFILAFAGGYLFFSAGDSSNLKQDKEGAVPEENIEQAGEVEPVDIPEEAYSLSRNSCLSCHSVESLGIQAGNIGPDLTIAYSGVEGKHGKDLDEFLQSPTSAVMATVIAGNPLEDHEREEIVKILKKASEIGEQIKQEAKDSD